LIHLYLAALLIASPADPCRLFQQIQDFSILKVPDAGLNRERAALQASHSACDRLYFPELSRFPHDENVYRDYFASAAQDPAILALILERFDELYPFLPSQYQDPFAMLERLFWANDLPDPAPCPCSPLRSRVHFRGFADEIASGCYRLILFFTLPPSPTEHTIEFSFDDPRFFSIISQNFAKIVRDHDLDHLERVLYTDTMPDTRTEPGQPIRRRPRRPS